VSSRDELVVAHDGSQEVEAAEDPVLGVAVRREVGQYLRTV
jgi:hypothetical protein